MRRNRRVTPEGTRDLLFEECLARREAEGRLTDLFVRRGFSEAMTPGIEFYDVFHADSMAIPAESMYKLSDDKGRLLVMRPDSTMPIARLAGARLQQAPLPIRLYYAQDVFHLNHGMTGHNDQEFQAGIELIGTGGQRADLEVLALAADALAESGCGDFRLEIGHVGFFHALVKELGVGEEEQDEIRSLVETKNYAALGDALDALPESDAVAALRRLPRLFGGEEVLEAAQPLCMTPQMKEALRYLAELYEGLCALGLSDQVMIDLGLVHRNEYYTGVIFRGYIEGSGETVVSGGRYDTLLEKFGRPLPATGFGVNVDALTKVMLDSGLVDPPMPPEVLVYAAPGFEIAGLKKVGELTGEGLICEYGIFDRLEPTLQYAQEKQISKVIAVGETIEVYEI
ncbi:MAG: ATP phosphoribosyltransferase regulatory subunit [Acutalibacteraceae bacterium]